MIRDTSTVWLKPAVTFGTETVRESGVVICFEYTDDGTGVIRDTSTVELKSAVTVGTVRGKETSDVICSEDTDSSGVTRDTTV